MSNTFLDPVTGLATERVQMTGTSIADGQTLWTPGMLFNETTSDKPRGNTQGTLLASAARTSNINSALLTNYNARGIIITIGVTAASGTSPTLQLQVLDSGGNGFAPGATVINAIGAYKYVLYPSNLTAPSNSIGTAQLPLPRQWQVFFAIGGTTPSFTFSATYDLIL